MTILAGVPVAFLRAANDPFGIPKASLAVVGAVIAGSLAVSSGVASGTVRYRRAPAVLWAIAAFVVALAFSVVSAPDLWLALGGSYGRWTGAVPYLAYVVLTLVMQATLAPVDVVRVVQLLVGVGVGLGLFAVSQTAGASTEFSGQFARAATATLGNPNFAGAYLGALTPLSLWIATSASRRSQRVLGLLGVIILIAGTVATRTLQGPLSAVIGMALFGVAWLAGQPRQRQRIAGATTALLVVLAVIAIPALDLVSRLSASGNLLFRRFYWSAAYRMFLSDPLTGVGMDHYSAYYRAFKPADTREVVELAQSSDAAHNVVLSMLSSGGLLLGLAYVAVVVSTGWLLWRSWRHAQDGPYRLLVAAIGGTWLAYQAQSMFSIDVPPLAVLHWGTIGMILVVADPQGGTATPPWGRGKGGANTAPRVQVVSSMAVAVLAVPLVWVALIPLRADLAAGTATDAKGPAAVDAAVRATEMWPLEGRYWFLRGRALVAEGRLERALEAFEEGGRRRPRDVENLVSAARVASELELHDRAAHWYERVLEVAPKDPELVQEARRVQAVDLETGQAD